MSQFSKKGFKLSTKRSSKRKDESKNQHLCKNDTSSLFSTVGEMKQEKNKDGLLVSFDPSATAAHGISPDVFVFPKKIINTPKNRGVLPEASSRDPGKQILKSESVFFNETNINSTSSEEHCLKRESNHARNQTKLDDSMLVFRPPKEVENIAEKSDICSSSDGDVPISDPKKNNGSTPPREVVKDATEDSDVEFIKQCPICFRTVPKYVTHMKICAAKNKLTTQQLLSALKLHKKQIAERQELGLGIPPPSFRAKTSPKKPRGNQKKGPVDSNLQLALALSASLRSAEEDEVIQEAEALKNAGLGEEAEKKLSVLESFGFVSALPPAPRIGQGSSRSRLLAESLLLNRSNEERERIITEKVAIVLISEEENVELRRKETVKDPVLRSRHLNRIWSRESELWRKAHCAKDEERTGFYVQSLSEFVSPSRAEMGENLRRLSQLPGRLRTPFQEKAEFSEQPTPPRLSMCRKSEHYRDSGSTGNDFGLNKLSADWKLLVNDFVFSDMEIQCKSGLTIPAHKLVFHVRCPSALEKIVHRENRATIEWQTLTKTSVLAFLEFVYAGVLKSLLNLNAEELCSVRDLADELDYSELKTQLRNHQEKHFRSVFDKSKEGEIQRKLYGANLHTPVARDYLNHESSRLLSISSTDTVELELKVKSTSELLKTSPKTYEIRKNSLDGRKSPDMFGEPSVIEEKPVSQESREDLDVLASLIGKPQYSSVNSKHSPVEDEVLVLDSPVLSSLNRSTSVKRKVQSNSFSEDENDSLSKKSRLHFPRSKVDLDKEDVFDLTQSRDSSKGELFKKNKFPGNNEDLTLNINSPDGSEEEFRIDNLTQKTPSPANSPQKGYPSSDNSPKSHNSDTGKDYIDPVWDGFDDDYLYYNYEVNTPDKSVRKNSMGQKNILISSDEKHSVISSSPKLSPKFTSISSDSKSHKEMSQRSLTPSSKTFDKNKFDSESFKKLTQMTISPLPKSSPTMKYISSDSESPKKFSQRTLNEYSPQNGSNNSKNLIGGSDIKSVGNVSPSGSLTYTYLKPRKNLNSQFDLSSSSLKRKISSKYTNDIESRTTDSDENNSRKKCSQNLDKPWEKSPKKKDSMDALKLLLDNSLEISDSVFATADAILASELEGNGNQQTERLGSPLKSGPVEAINKNKSSLTTPSPEIIVSDIVTPLPDYSAMKTPSLKKELGRFGLKPSLGRRKAKMLLRYIYDQTHPLVGDPESKQPEGQPPRTPEKSPSKSDPEECLSQQSSESSSATLPEESSYEQDDSLTQELSTGGDVRTCIKSLMFSDRDLHRKVLSYEPIYLEELLAMLKANGIKSKANDVMDFLDEQCITFRTTSWKVTNEKRRQKQRTPKKKRKETNESKPLTQQRKSTPKKTGLTSEAPCVSNVVKKRGRPRKNSKAVDNNN